MSVKVSVIIPSLNSINYYDECIKSVMKQSLKELEIICVDANSTDGTLELIKKYQAKDERIKLIISDKKSYGYQMNLGIAAASGEYVGIVESDDYIKEDMYKRLYETAKQNDCDIVKSDFFIFTDTRLDYEKVSRFDEFYNTRLNALEDLRLFWTNGINQIVLNETPGASYQDNGLFFQLFCFAKSIYFLNEAFYMLRRDNPNSSVHSKEKVYMACLEYDYIRNFLQKYPSFESLVAPICAYHRYGNYIFTLERIDDKYKKDFLKRFREDFMKIIYNGELKESLYTPTQLCIIKEIVEDSDAYYYTHICPLKNTAKRSGAVLRVQKQLSYRLGLELLKTKSFVKALNLPFRIYKQVTNFRLERKIYESLSAIDEKFILPPLEDYTDFGEALETKKHLSYRLGQALLKNPILFPFKIKKIYEEFKAYKNAPKRTDFKLEAISDEEYFIKRHEEAFNYTPDFKNPKTFNEKLIHRILYDRSEIYTFLADKLKGRIFVADILSGSKDILKKDSPLYKDIDSLKEELLKTNECKYLPKLYGIYDNIYDINFSILPDSFVLKTNHDAGGYVIVEDKKEFLKDTKRFSEAMRKLKEHLEKNYYLIFREWHYRGIKPRIFAEELLKNEENGLLDTYKFHIFDKNDMKNNYVQVTTDRFENYQRTMMTNSWEIAPFNFIYEIPTKIPPKPQSLEAMWDLALKLASPFDYVRVDLYQNKDKIYVGELTFTHGAAIEQLVPGEWDEKLGALWHQKRLVDVTK
ncbi:ATP-grasp fold amidoligase family protein [Campylobacter upsaliensis]|uniref:ATP-grasp fold amidoligase family protein n=1 Tax=Campylobacter upsaliensis TaxID=28080 RepID=UPI001CE0C014|nr:ATP-grasp fold amidoligase family protein [Campylobacter upsaliensis]MCA5589217.1 glycosyltransferase [Campylobacter upsaliensis]